MRLSTDEAFKRAEQIREDWNNSVFKTYTDLAQHYELSINYVSKIIKGIKCFRMESPKGTHKIVDLYGVKYIVYEDGRIWSTVYNRFMEFKRKGYQSFYVKDVNKKRHKIKVHRLILTTFKRPPKKGEVCRHLDDDPAHNHISNLAWGSPQDNSGDKILNDGQSAGEQIHTAKMTNRMVKLLVKGYDSQFVDEYAKDFKRKHKLDIGSGQLIHILSGKYWSHITGIKKRNLPRKHNKTKLDEKAVRNIHRNWAKYKGTKQEFSIKFADYLESRGYAKITPANIRKILLGKTWKHIYEEYN